MRFPSSEKLHMPCRFAHFVPGKLNQDGRRYLPLVVLELPEIVGITLLGVTDRHHLVDPARAGSKGSAQLVFLLSRLRIQEPPLHQGMAPEPEARGERPSTAPFAFGRVLEVLSWEVENIHLPYEALYVELLLDVGCGTVGVRTSQTAASLAESIGKSRIEAGDWIDVGQSRIDILGFQ